MSMRMKTIDWAKNRDMLFRFAKFRFGDGFLAIPRPVNFVEFIDALPVNHSVRVVALQDFIEQNELEDITSSVTADEDSTLMFPSIAEEGNALNIVLSYLEQLIVNDQAIPATWCYLDDEKLSVVHFTQSGQVSSAEMYCCCHRNYSALHVVELADTTKILPVVFACKKNFTIYQQLAELSGGRVLRDYLPREKFDCLSHGRKNSEPLKHVNPQNHLFPPQLDRGDML
ncbi:MAG: hypothetical protein IJ864_01125 [Alphaproteobacteria bacterium]|nr:hypothetical protein [Alphaproteobacteria bacterium]